MKSWSYNFFWHRVWYVIGGAFLSATFWGWVPPMIVGWYLQQRETNLMHSEDAGGVVVLLLTFVFWIVTTGGFIANIYKLVAYDESTKMELLRIVGIFVAPLGVVLGFL